MMPTYIICFLIGVITCLGFKQVPSLSLILIIIAVGLSIQVIKNLPLRMLGMIVLGIGYTLLHGYLRISWDLPVGLENKPLCLVGYIDSIPIYNEQSIQFNFRLLKRSDFPLIGTVQLTSYNTKCPYHVGEKWQLVAKLKKAHGLCNPGSSDAEQHSFSKNFRAVGSIVSDESCYLITKPRWTYPIQRLREYLESKVLTQMHGHPLSGIVLALTLGRNHLITSGQWQVFRQTGTNHLVAISGLHIGLVASLVGRMMRFIWVRVPYGPLFLASNYISIMWGSCAGLIYGVLAGLSASTLRSIVMIAILTLAALGQRRITTFRSLLFALGSILLIDPFYVLSVGFWLSFIAVFLLIYGMNGRPKMKGFWWKWGRAQFVVTIGMLPTLFCFFQQASLLSIPANLLAVPWISLLVVPVCLLGFVLLPLSNVLSDWILQIALSLLQLIWWYLDKLTHASFLIWHQAFVTRNDAIMAHLAAYICLLPSGLINNILRLLVWLPLATAPVLQGIQPNSIQMTVLDVGQGLSVVVRTQQHTLLFDTGAKFNEESDMGNRVIIPYLRVAGVNKLDVMAISHGDNDHIGGAQSVLKALPVAKIMTSVPEKFPGLHPIECKDHLSWMWDGVKFQFLSPSNNHKFSGNNASCVLKVSNQKYSLLLTGDIEKQAEDDLLIKHLKELTATVLVAPHHGSKTSSSPHFVSAVNPQYVIFSCGYLNRYKHPHPTIVRRYQDYSSTMLNTVSSGAITMTLPSDSDMVIDEYRKSHHKIWHH